MLRSAPMTLCQIIDHNDAARNVIAALGELGVAQMKDMNPDVALYRRAFSDEMRRCEELYRRLTFIVEQLQVTSITAAPRDAMAMQVRRASLQALQRRLAGVIIPSPSCVVWRPPPQESIIDLEPEIRRVQAELLVLKGEIGPDTLVQTQQSVRPQSMIASHFAGRPPSATTSSPRWMSTGRARRIHSLLACRCGSGPGQGGSSRDFATLSGVVIPAARPSAAR